MFDWGFLQQRLELMLTCCHALSQWCVVLTLTSIHVWPLTAVPQALGHCLLSVSRCHVVCMLVVHYYIHKLYCNDLQHTCPSPSLLPLPLLPTPRVHACTP